MAERSTLRVRQPARRLGLVVGDLRFELAVRNISAQCLSGEARVLLEPGQCVSVEFENSLVRSASVRWARGTTLGLEFAQALPLELVCGGEEADQPGLPPRRRRFPIDEPAMLYTEGLARAASIRNLSAGGLLVECTFAPQAGQLVRVECKGLRLPTCQVRWSHGDRVGLMFISPISALTLLSPDAGEAVRHLCADLARWEDSEARNHRLIEAG